MRVVIKLMVVFTLLCFSINLIAQNQKEPVAGENWKIPEVGMEFVWVKTLDCWVGKYEVTNGEYLKFKPGHDSKDVNGITLSGDRQPVVYVNYNDATEYARCLNESEKKAGRLPAGYSYRLPSGNEWLTFCQCGDGRAYPWGNSLPPKYGNYSVLEEGSGYDDGFPLTCPVEMSGRNDWGIYGVGGNVWECTVKSGNDLSFDAWRGASWLNTTAVFLRCSHRDSDGGEYSDFNFGFRLILAR